MNPLKLESPTRTLAKDQPEYMPLDIVDTVEGGVPMMSSAWTPSSEELAALNRGEHVTLVVIGTQHPPVNVFVFTD